MLARGWIPLAGLALGALACVVPRNDTTTRDAYAAVGDGDRPPLVPVVDAGPPPLVPVVDAGPPPLVPVVDAGPPPLVPEDAAPPPSGPACGPGDGTCPGGCSPAADPDCRLASGATCTAGAACATGFCVDDVCCDRTCASGCEACNNAGSLGTCGPMVLAADPAFCAAGALCLAANVCGEYDRRQEPQVGGTQGSVALIDLAEVFTPRKTGTLVGVRVLSLCNVGAQLTVEVQGVRSGVGGPDGIRVTSAVSDVATVRGEAWRTITFGTPPRIVAGSPVALKWGSVGDCWLEYTPPVQTPAFPGDTAFVRQGQAAWQTQEEGFIFDTFFRP